ncbi:uncharacterized protein B0I36DRAFT_2647 [Microdochium trichocladiopsis]|uniref:Uncharacterized protein n=1 Tax=Microdochium trichocladiopsis TaxID=1682393 RepID=A0A9P8YIU5_9PEZI|nr:uncharacterized protein B0I36DRAFT_2647 [Microdochium trichocladiopsis]KAH7039819.1 hypothetical protein B0I36DRAFT_2647 [Microdochium trichocladiopsis]
MDQPPRTRYVEDEDNPGRRNCASSGGRPRGDLASRAGAVKVGPCTHASRLGRDPPSPLRCPLLMGWISFVNIWCASTAYRRSESWESSSTSNKILMAVGMIGVFNMAWLIVALVHRSVQQPKGA